MLATNLNVTLMAATVVNPGDGSSSDVKTSDDDDDWVGAKGNTFESNWEED